YFVQRLFLLFRGTATVQILVGLVTLRLLLLVAQRAGLVWTSLLLNEANAWVPLLIIVLFRHEIREALLQTSPIRLLVGRPRRGGRRPRRPDRPGRGLSPLVAAGGAAGGVRDPPPRGPRPERGVRRRRGHHLRGAGGGLGGPRRDGPGRRRARGAGAGAAAPS